MDNRTEYLEKILTALPKATTSELREFVDFLEQKHADITPLVKRSEVAKIIGLSTKRVDQLAREGKLERVFFGDARRATGYTRESVERLMSKRIANFDQQLSALGNMVKKEISRICDFDLTDEGKD